MDGLTTVGIRMAVHQEERDTNGGMTHITPLPQLLPGASPVIFDVRRAAIFPLTDEVDREAHYRQIVDAAARYVIRSIARAA